MRFGLELSRAIGVCRRGAALLASCLLLTGAGWEKVPDHPGKWHPWHDEVHELSATARRSAELKAAFAEVERIQAVFARAKPLERPVGFNVLRSRSYYAEGFPRSTYLLMILKDLWRKCPTCPVEDAAEGPGFHIYVNRISPLVPQNGIWQQELMDGHKLFPEPELAAEKELAGFPLYQGSFSIKWVVIARPGRPPMWKPVSTERALTLLIAGLEKKVAWGRSGAKTPRDLQFRVGREIELLEGVKRELAGLSAEERARQAWSGCKITSKDYQERPSFLCRGEPTGKRVTKYVEVNGDYWDRSLPATRPQLIMLDVMFRDDRKRPWRHPLAKPVVDSLDWKALGEIVNPRE